MLKIRQMLKDDIFLGLRLRDQAGWNQSTVDWQRFLALEPRGCFVAEWEGQPVATTTTSVFGPVGWIAMVLVERSARHRGIGTRIVEHAVEYLTQNGVRTIRLDATALGRPVYERLGFRAEYSLSRWQGTAHRIEVVDDGILAVSREDLADLAELDQRATGTRRAKLLELLRHDSSQGAAKLVMDNQLVGYVLTRAGIRATQIGPAVALEQAAGVLLLDWAFSRCAGSPLFVDMPQDNHAAMRWSASRGLTVQREFTRMYRGDGPLRDNRDWLWASSGPEKG